MKKRAALGALAMMLSVPTMSWSQTGVSDDRVSLPAGPGSLEGVGENVSINPNMGSMQYSVPIKTPTGIGGMQPELGLIYSSSSPAGVVGIGWSMRAPTIERMTSRGNPRYETTDFMAADGGMELVLVDDSGPDHVYRERFEKGFKRYTWINAGRHDADSWKVEYPDGKVGYFGANADGQRVESARTSNEEGAAFKYHLVEMLDPFGNRVAYEYTRPQGSTRALMSKASWLFVDGAPNYSATMTYEDRGEAVIDAGGGFEEILAHRLRGIELFARGELVREYELSYETLDEAGGFTRLSGVKEYGLGGKQGGIKNPIAFTFAYQKALGVECSGEECRDRPYLVDMGSVSGGLDLNSGFATFIDINGDALPDILDTSSVGNHKFFINQLNYNDADGSFSHNFAPQALESQVGTSGFLRLGGEGKVQALDIDGDGYSDLTNTATGAFLLKDPDSDDWEMPNTSLDVSTLVGLDFGTARFFDYNGDKKIDVLISSGPTTRVIENKGDSFSTDGVPSVTTLGIGFADSNLQMSDINGDGMPDAVQILTGNRLRHRVNLGWGRFTEFRDLRIGGNGEITQSDLAFTELEDLNGDGRDDIVIVSPTSVRYALNRGNKFDAFVQLDQARLGFDIPQRGLNTRVLFADMNANGSRDITWMEGSNVRYLELFPERPNLLARVENGIGSVQKITYGTAVEHQARARAAGQPWTKSLQIPMAVVDKTNVFVTLTGDEDDSPFNDVVDFTYQDGFYDGIEKQYRGFETIAQSQQGGTFQQEGQTIMEYDVGANDPYFNGLLLRSSLSTGDTPIREELKVYADCPVAEVPGPAALEGLGRKAVRYVCQTRSILILKEGVAEPEWKTLQTDMEYDGYGNVIKTESLGVVDVDGDEMVQETTFVAPDDIWHLNLPAHTKTYVKESKGEAESWFYYDGEAFVGEPKGVATRGFLTRQVTKVDGSGRQIHTLRQRPDSFGNIVEMIDPNGEVANEDEHRTLYSYDRTGRFLSATERRALDDEGNPYTLRRESRFDQRWQKVNLQVDWVVVKDGQPQTPRNETTILYDDLGRFSARVNAGDQPSTPSMEVTYDLGDPVSRVSMKMRSELNGALDRETVRCVDGLGRGVQNRTLIEPGRYLVTGFTAFSRRGATIESYEPYEATTDECEPSAPQGVRVTRTRYDAQFRPLERVQPDEELHGTASLTRYEYEPLLQRFHDAEDTDASGPHANTPTIRHFDGQQRVRELERVLNQDGTTKTSSYKLFYDNTGSFAGYEDPRGNRHQLTVDLAGRVTQIQNENIGVIALEYDDLGNQTARTDARGVTLRTAYDSLNRIKERWDDADRENTLTTWFYDLNGDCAVTECTNPASRLTRVNYPMVVEDDVMRGHKRFGFDARGRTIFEAYGWDELDLGISNTYNNQNELTQRVFPDGTINAIELDGVGRTVSIASILDEVAYTPRGLLEQMTYANDAATKMSYDAMMRPATLANFDATSQALESFVYARDRQGNIIGVADDSGRTDVPDASQTLDYDAWYRLVGADLTAASGQNESLNYVFDELDNVVSLTSTLKSASPSHVGQVGYDAERPNAVETAGSMSYAHDRAGHMTRRGDVSMDWDHQMRMTHATRQGDPARYLYSETARQVATLKNDGLDLYGPASFEVRDGIAVTYFRLQGKRVAQRRSTELMTTVYADLVADGQINAADAFAAITQDTTDQVGLSQATSPRRVLGAAAARLLTEQEDSTTFLHTDHLGSITVATNEGGAARGQRSFYPTGVLRWSQGHVDRYGFTGQEHMDSGLVRFLYRHLDPRVGRWASFDPLFMALTAQQLDAFGEATTGYAYVANNFANTVDPLGLNGRKSSRSSLSSKGSRQSSSSSLGSRRLSDSSLASKSTTLSFNRMNGHILGYSKKFLTPTRQPSRNSARSNSSNVSGYDFFASRRGSQSASSASLSPPRAVAPGVNHRVNSGKTSAFDRNWARADKFSGVVSVVAGVLLITGFTGILIDSL